LGKRWFRVSEGRLDRFDGWFDRWGPVVIPVSNSLLFTRGMLTVPAGFAKMSNRQFLALSALGTLAFETILAALAVGLIELF
jgi:membrane protein DedA with SNARE-associated domain